MRRLNDLSELIAFLRKVEQRERDGNTYWEFHEINENKPLFDDCISWGLITKGVTLALGFDAETDDVPDLQLTRKGCNTIALLHSARLVTAVVDHCESRGVAADLPIVLDLIRRYVPGMVHVVVPPQSDSEESETND
ncbi:MAG: hypothetical protein ACR2P3_03670 [Geminicoccaceae bacterium]